MTTQAAQLEDENVVPMDDLTAARLTLFAARVGKSPAETAAALLRDLLADPDFWDAAGDVARFH